MLEIILVLLIIVGAVIYLATDRPKVSEIGRITFAFALLVFLLNLANLVAKLPR